jgi:benzoylformate decarboxylase
MPTVREAVIKLLADLGLTTIFGNPGSTELPLLGEFPKEFRYILGLQESIVVGMADGYAQATRNAALVNLHSAAGVGHAMGNIFTAFRNRTPLVITAGQQARSIIPYEPFLFATEATELPKPYVKWSNEPARAEDVPAAIARAYYTAMQPPCGPTFVSIPVDDWARTTEWLPRRDVTRTVLPDPAFIARLGDRLNRCARPAFVVGPGVDREGAWDEVVALAERHQARVWVSPMSPRCGFPERHTLFAGFLPAIREQIVECLGGHDLILALGAQVFTYHIEGFGPHVPDAAEMFQIVDDPGVAAWTPASTSIVGSIRHAVISLLDRTDLPTRPAPRQREIPARVTPGETISVAYLMQTLSDLRPADSIVVEEAPSSRKTMQAYLPIDRPESFFTCASGGLGHGLPAAVGIALARGSGQRVIGLFGDGSAMYSIQALWSAAQYNLPMTIVIVNNRGYAALGEFSSHFKTTGIVGTRLDGIDFAGLACSLGCAGQRVTTPDQLTPALTNALGAPAPSLVDVVVA